MDFEPLNSLVLDALTACIVVSPLAYRIAQSLTAGPPLLVLFLGP